MAIISLRMNNKLIMQFCFLTKPYSQFKKKKYIIHGLQFWGFALLPPGAPKLIERCPSEKGKDMVLDLLALFGRRNTEKVEHYSQNEFGKSSRAIE